MVLDCPLEAAPCWCRRWRIRGMAFLIHYRLCWWYRSAKCGMEDLDLDGTLLRCRSSVRLFYVS